jgi:hypothetical protein
MSLPLKRSYEGESMYDARAHSHEGVDCHSNVEVSQHIHMLHWKEHDPRGYVGSWVRRFQLRVNSDVIHT